MSLASAGLLALVLLAQAHPAAPAQPRLYRWRDTAGQVHITTTRPPADAEILEGPQAPAVEPEKAIRPDKVRRSEDRDGHRQPQLSPAQQQAWEAIDHRLTEARAGGDKQTIEAVADALFSHCLWGNGLWIMPAVPLLSVALMGLLGWWLALGLRSGPRIPLIAGFLLLGFGFGHLLLNLFLYQPQAVRLRQNLELLEHHLGTSRDLRDAQRTLLQQRYQAMEEAAEPLQAPWRFPAEVEALRAAMKQVMVEP
ncbi:hypothetical protein GETHLI_20720 [Geothrix limicola]|uniref:DUF4124 domain-containing protein n=1 Tax=Geothrix limicola TaxID=2927978 RepID=A0ABQ5QFF2_9BACT|nr:DUF4124 domain-containing protein [Geothrix limicola]GLH73570.1 hypothetical protein GETHLI_20720 [Geothrix limicola]